MYPIVTHWAWDENGWLYKGVEYTKDNVTMTVAYQVRFKYQPSLYVTKKNLSQVYLYLPIKINQDP